MLFENDRLNISALYNVVEFAPRHHMKYTYPERPSTYEFMYFYEGDVTVAFEESTVHVTAGDILYLPKGLNNSEYTMYVNEEFSLYNFYFDTPDALPQVPICIKTENDELKHLYEKLYRTWVGKRPGYYYKAMQQTYGILERVYRIGQRYTPNSKFAYLQPAEEYIAEHYSDMHFDYDKLHELSGLSYSYFKKLFTDKHGYPPVKYITHLKIDRACELLQTNKFSISEIAQLCGFENVYYFSNVFKKIKGVSPTHYGCLSPVRIEKEC